MIAAATIAFIGSQWAARTAFDAATVQIGVNIRSADPTKSDVAPARGWAIGLVEKHSGQEFTAEDRASLLHHPIQSQTFLPPLYEARPLIIKGMLHVAYPLARRAFESLSLLVACFLEPKLADRWIAGKQVGHAEIRRVLAAHPMGEKETQTRDLYFFFSKATHPNRDYMARRYLGEGNEFVLGAIGQSSLAMSLDYALETLNLWFWFAASVVFRYRDVLSQSDPELFRMYHDAAEAAGPVAAWLREQFNHVLAEEQGKMRGLESE